ncbi:MAG TPA: hypothetical protein VM324_15445 [Egibacteraceae bacterium]|jgi:hypothetical protein|nr:hypothetical protein [Egibacteraceae bacterium]
MTEQTTVARTLHDAGLAAWFGGSLMGAVGLNGASQEVSDYRDRTRVANAGWGRWTPVNALAILAHLVGALQITRTNKSRLGAQRGVGTATAVKLGLTTAALGATAYSRVLGQKVMDAEATEALQAAENGSGTASEGLPVEDATHPAPGTNGEVAKAQKQLNALQWAVPALTGATLVVNAKMSEQQRLTQQLKGIVGRVNPKK